MPHQVSLHPTWRISSKQPILKDMAQTICRMAIRTQQVIFPQVFVDCSGKAIWLVSVICEPIRAGNKSIADERDNPLVIPRF